MTKKTQVKAITEGGIFAAVYCLLTLLTKYLLTGTDSLIYYIWPLPIAIYSARHKLVYGIATTTATILLSFLFTTPVYVLMLIIPNLLIGFLMGVLESKTKFRFINYIVIFIIALIADFLSIYAYEFITGIGYFDDVVEILTNFSKNLTNIDSNIIKTVVEITSIVTLIIDSLIKEVLLYMLFVIIVKRLNLIPNYKINLKIPLNYHYSLTIIYILISSSLIILLKYISVNHIILELLIILILSILFIISFYLLYQLSMFFRIKLRNLSNGLFIIVIILEFILLPISIIISLILNLLNWNFVNAALK